MNSEEPYRIEPGMERCCRRDTDRVCIVNGDLIAAQERVKEIEEYLATLMEGHMTSHYYVYKHAQILLKRAGR